MLFYHFLMLYLGLEVALLLLLNPKVRYKYPKQINSCTSASGIHIGCGGLQPTAQRNAWHPSHATFLNNRDKQNPGF